jgi:hypothetical protein
MTWLVIKCFLEQWKALMERKKEDFGLPPKLTKHYPVHKWMELMVLYLGQWEFVTLPLHMWFGPGQLCPPFPLLFRRGNHTLNNMDQSRVI